MNEVAQTVQTVQAAEKPRAQRLMEDKLRRILPQRQTNGSAVLERIDRDNSLLSDSLVPWATDQRRFTADNGVLQLEVLDQDFAAPLNIHSHALNQISSKLSVPQGYVNNLQATDWGRNLTANIFNTTRMHSDKTVLIREVGGEIRGVMSDKYRRMDVQRIYTQFITGMRAHGAVFFDAFYSDVKVYMKAVIPHVFAIETPNNGTEYMIFGVMLRDSQFGASKLEVSEFAFKLVCDNGMIGTRFLSNVHLGADLKVDDNGVFSQGTYDKYTDAAVSAVRDILGNTVSPDAIRRQVDNIKQLSSEVIDIKTEIKQLPQLGLSMGEVEKIEAKLLNSDPATGVTGRPTKWKLVNAINNTGNEIGGERALELEDLAGKYAGIQ